MTNKEIIEAVRKLIDTLDINDTVKNDICQKSEDSKNREYKDNLFFSFEYRDEEFEDIGMFSIDG